MTMWYILDITATSGRHYNFTVKIDPANEIEQIAKFRADFAPLYISLDACIAERYIPDEELHQIFKDNGQAC
jgi:hypothetical protein